MQARRIINVKKIGKKRSVDIEVNSKEHLFYGNGIATSNSHSVSYAETSYWTAYAKYKYPMEFFTSYLEYSGEKQDKKEEISELISEAKLFDIEVKICNINKFKPSFFMDRKERTIYFGLKDVKSLTGKNGDKCIEEINKLKETLKKEISELSWMDILLYLSDNIVSTSFRNLCSVGFFSSLRDSVTRTRAIYEFEIYKKLSIKEKEWVLKNYPLRKWNSLLSCLIELQPTKKEGGGTSNINRKNTIANEILLLKSPPYELDTDDPSWICSEEEKILGCPVSISKNEASGIEATSTCEEISNGIRKKVSIVGEIEKIKFHTIKKEGVNFDREMAFLSVKDETGVLDSVILFPDTKEEYRFSLFEGNNIFIKGESKDGSLIVESIKDI
jgi:DNA polymerase III alpha subunit